MDKFEIDNEIVIPIGEREKRLALAQSIYDRGGIGKRTAAVMAISQLGNWRNIDDPTSSIDFLRQRLIAKTIHSATE